jgi:hypothetical protein
MNNSGPDIKELFGVLGALAFIVLASWIFVSAPEPGVTVTNIASFPQALWDYRPLDVLLQLFIILSGTLGILMFVKER